MEAWWEGREMKKKMVELKIGKKARQQAQMEETMKALRSGKSAYGLGAKK